MIASLIQDLQRRGVFLSLAEGQIRYRASKDALTDADKDALRARKSEIEAYLRARQAARTLQTLKGRPGPLTASVVQEMFYRFAGGPNEGQPVALNISAVLPVKDCEPERLAQILHRVVTRHETLLSHIRVEGERLHLSLNAADAFAVEIEDLGGEGGAPAAATAKASAFCSLLKPIEGDWLTRAKIWVIAEGECLAAISSSHLVSDAGTRNILVDEINDLLEGRELPPPAIVFNAYALAERDFLESPEAQPLFDYWKRWYAAQPLLHAPDGGPPLLWGPGTRIVNNFAMPGHLVDAARRLADRHQVTPFLVHLTLYALALARWSGAEAFPIRILGDKRTRLELEHTAGLMFCADPVDVVAPPDADFETVMRGLQRAYDMTLSLRLPSLHFYPPQCAMPGIEPRDIPNRIPAVFNYYAAGTARERQAAQGTVQPDRPWPPQVTTLPPMQWTRPSPPVFLHFMDHGAHADLSLHFYENAVPKPQQAAFFAALLASYDALLSS